MSSLRFTKAPSRPDHIQTDVWEKEWTDLVVGLASVFPLGIGYLGEGHIRIWDDVTKFYRYPTSNDSMNYLRNELCELMWISRESLVHTCTYFLPPRPVILAWLEEESQKYRTMFAVPDSVAEYLP